MFKFINKVFKWIKRKSRIGTAGKINRSNFKQQSFIKKQFGTARKINLSNFKQQQSLIKTEVIVSGVTNKYTGWTVDQRKIFVNRYITGWGKYDLTGDRAVNRLKQIDKALRSGEIQKHFDASFRKSSFYQILKRENQHLKNPYKIAAQEARESVEYDYKKMRKYYVFYNRAYEQSKRNNPEFEHSEHQAAAEEATIKKYDVSIKEQHHAAYEKRLDQAIMNLENN